MPGSAGYQSHINKLIRSGGTGGGTYLYTGGQGSNPNGSPTITENVNVVGGKVTTTQVCTSGPAAQCATCPPVLGIEKPYVDLAKYFDLCDPDSTFYTNQGLAKGPTSWAAPGTGWHTTSAYTGLSYPAVLVHIEPDGQAAYFFKTVDLLAIGLGVAFIFGGIWAGPFAFLIGIILIAFGVLNMAFGWVSP